MRKLIVLACVLFLLIALYRCKREETTKPVPDLEVNIRDSIGHIISGANVYLFRSEYDWTKRINPINHIISDEYGKVQYFDLTSNLYYLYVEKDCQNNANDGNTIITSSLISIPNEYTNSDYKWYVIKTDINKIERTLNSKRVLNLELNKTGTLYFVNSSSDTYHILINDKSVSSFTFDRLEVEGNHSHFVAYAPAGFYKIKVIKNSTNDTLVYTGTLHCGNTFTVTFPSKYR